MTLFGEAFEKIAPGAQLASPAIFGTHEMKEKIKVGATNKEVLDIISKEADGAIDNTFNILTYPYRPFRRCSTQYPESRHLRKNRYRVTGYQGTATCERVVTRNCRSWNFYETFDNAKGQDAGEDAFFNYLVAADQKLKEVLDRKHPM